MAKKYLLYIHDSDTFDKVNNKSELVNDLLEKHWNTKTGVVDRPPYSASHPMHQTYRQTVKTVPDITYEPLDD